MASQAPAMPPLTVAPNLSYRESVDSIWTQALSWMIHARLEINISLSAFEIIGWVGLKETADRFSEYIGEEATVICDFKLGIFRILAPIGHSSNTVETVHDAPESSMNLPVPSSTSTLPPGKLAPSSSPTTISDRLSRNARDKVAKIRVAKIPRPQNAFILYRKHHHQRVKEENPGLHNNKISIIIGNLWKNESNPVKELYKTEAKKLADDQKKKYPDYQYQPRKPSQKKHRKTKTHATEQDSSMATAAAAMSDLEADFEDLFALDSTLSFDPALLNPTVFTMLEDVNPANDEVPQFEINEDGLMSFDLTHENGDVLARMAHQHNEQQDPAQLAPGADEFLIATERTEEGLDDYWNNEALIDPQDFLDANSSNETVTESFSENVDSTDNENFDEFFNFDN